MAAAAVHARSAVSVPAAGFPADFTYLNFGQTTQKGIELGVNSTVTPLRRTAFANYSYQATPTSNFALSEVNLPAKNRFNIGFNFSRSRFLGDLTVTYSGQRVLAGRAGRPLPRHD